MNSDEYLISNQQNNVANLSKKVENSNLARSIGPEAAVRLIEKYRHHLEACILSLKDSLDKEDLENIRGVAHSLKGSGKSYGMDYVTQIGLSLSSRAKEKDFRGVKELIGNLQKWVADSFPGDLT